MVLTIAVAVVSGTESGIKTGEYAEDHGYSKNSNGMFSIYVV